MPPALQRQLTQVPASHFEALNLERWEASVRAKSGIPSKFSSGSSVTRRNATGLAKNAAQTVTLFALLQSVNRTAANIYRGHAHIRRVCNGRTRCACRRETDALVARDRLLSRTLWRPSAIRSVRAALPIALYKPSLAVVAHWICQVHHLDAMSEIGEGSTYAHVD